MAYQWTVLSHDQTQTDIEMLFGEDFGANALFTTAHFDRLYEMSLQWLGKDTDIWVNLIGITPDGSRSYDLRDTHDSTEAGMSTVQRVLNVFWCQNGGASPEAALAAGGVYELDFRERAEVATQITLSDTGSPDVWYYDDQMNQIGVWPVPSTTGTNEIVVRAVFTPPMPTSTSALDNVPQYAQRALLAYILSLMHKREGLEKESREQRNLAETEKLEIQRLMRQGRVQSTGRTRDRAWTDVMW